MSELKIISGIYWDPGRRELNQDSVALLQVVTGAGRVLFAAVSDGIGGLAEGEIASGYITERLIENFYDQMLSLAGRKKGKRAMERSLLRCLYDINSELKFYGKGKDLKLGATLSLLFVWQRRYVIVHLGDSRIYLCHKKGVKQLTADHCDGGRGLTRCIGSFPFQAPDILDGKIYGKCGFLLCTDGFYRKLGKEIFDVLNPDDIESEEQVKRRLREMAAISCKRGEQDNMSAVYAVFR
ncbi:serine/threonine-protein phosphatase [Parablautia intestinalis]|uniref:Serine/threonine-protein phosphatase n=1 Tax=Parablautia intestinalis TaxID=2320100 RepID=A0A3A9B4J2_9FIRM|nr:serine/threonine-protein phosphatase [Parablautia intestinalis]